MSLTRTTWQLASYGPLAAPVPAVAHANARIVFGTDGRVSGSSGCNNFSGAYSIANKQITFSAIAATRAACVGGELSRQEQGVFAALHEAARYTVTDMKLQILYDEGRSALTFTSSAPATMATVTGTVTYREKSALPAGAVVDVLLQDTSRADAPAITLAEQVITTNGQQVPISFSLAYDPARIDERMTYTVRASIRIEDRLVFTSTQAYPVITRGWPTEVEIVMERISR